MSTAAARLHRVRTDAALLRRFRAGDETAFAALHARHADDIRRYAAYMLRGSAHDPDDAAQDVFLRAYQSLRRDEREIDVRPWLFRVAHNRCIDVLRRPVADELGDAPGEGVASGDPAAAIEQRETMRALLRDIGALTDGQRSALLLRELGGLSHEAVGEALGITTTSSRMLVHRARLALTEAAEARDTTCVDVRERLTAAADLGTRVARRDRRHLADCTDCAAWRAVHARVERELSLLVPAGFGIGALVKAFGGGGAAGSGAVAAGAGGGGAALVWGMVAKLTVGACCACSAPARQSGSRRRPTTRTRPRAGRWSRPGSVVPCARRRRRPPPRRCSPPGPPPRPRGLARRARPTHRPPTTAERSIGPGTATDRPPVREDPRSTVDLFDFEPPTQPPKATTKTQPTPTPKQTTVDLAGFDRP